MPQYTVLQLDTVIDDLNFIVEHPNLAEEFSKDDLGRIGMYCKETYDKDKLDRNKWEEKMVPVLKSAMQLYEEKTFPWAGASNVKLPLITIAGFQYHTRAYSLLVPGQDVVRLTYYGDDPTGAKSDASMRIAEHMNYQILEQDPQWEANADLTFLVQSIMGCAFKKGVLSPEDGFPVLRFVSPWDLVVPYYTQSLQKAVRISHRLCYTQNDCYERKVRGVFLEVEGDPNQYSAEPDKLDEIKKEVYGGSAQKDYESPYDVIEQSRFLDLDNDGYSEPYVVTFVQATGQVLRIAARFFEDDVQYRAAQSKNGKRRLYRIKPFDQFVKYPFIPSIDGCFYDTGYGSVLGGLSDSIDSNINQLVDSGTLNNLGGGFISRGLTLRTGNYKFVPGEYKIVDATGSSLQEGIRDLPVRQPSEVLLQLVQILLDYADRVAGSTEPQQGENPGQNTPRANYINMLDEGGKIFRGLFKRTHRAFREEMNLLYKLNSLYLSKDTIYFNSLSQSKTLPISRMDYLDNIYTVRPSADPEIGSDAMKFSMAQALNELADNSEGFDQYQVKKRMLKTMRISNIDEIYPPPETLPPQEPPEDPKVTVANIKALESQFEAKLDAKINLIKILMQQEISKSRMAAIEAKSALLLSKGDQAAGPEQVDKRIEDMNEIEDKNQGKISPLEDKVVGASQYVEGMTEEPIPPQPPVPPSDTGIIPGEPEIGEAPAGPLQE